MMQVATNFSDNKTDVIVMGARYHTDCPKPEDGTVKDGQLINVTDLVSSREEDPGDCVQYES